MFNLKTIYLKELKSYFNSPMAYIFLVIFALINGYFFTRTFFLFNQSDMILKVNSPTNEEIQMIKDGTTYLSFFQTMKETDKVKALQSKNVTAYSMHLIPRTTLAQKMDALSSQTNISGYKAVLIGSCHIEKYMPLLMTAAGTIPPAKVLVLGAGVAGLAAIATSKRLGAQVYAFDVRPVVKEQVESLGAKFIEVESETDEGTGEGGYAKEVSEDYKRKQSELIKETMAFIEGNRLDRKKPAAQLVTVAFANKYHREINSKILTSCV